MHVLLIGAVIGFVIGGMIGGGAFGLIGFFAGGIVGALVGSFTLPMFAVASADEYANHPHLVSCPATGDLLSVQVSRKSARAASLDPRRRPEVTDCPRWQEHGRCNGPCNRQLHV